ncbi:Trefoil factor 3 [Allomyces javanicus]|nr:Trefoil factor 3 [Allomyces javanicus]
MSSRKTTKVPQVEEVRRPVSDDESDDGEEEFEVEKILDHKAKKDGQMMYYLKWKGYAIDDATWEDTDCLCEDLLRDYWAKKRCDIDGRPLKTGSTAAAPAASKKSAAAATTTKPAASSSARKRDADSVPPSSSLARKRDLDAVAQPTSTSAARRRDAEPASSSSSSTSRKREHEPAPSTSSSSSRRRDPSPRPAPTPSAAARKRDLPTSSTAAAPAAKRARTSAAAPVTPSPTTPDPAAAPYDVAPDDDEKGVAGVGDVLSPPGEVYAAPMDMVHEQKLDPNLASWDDLVEEILTLDMDPTSKQPYVYLKLKSGEHDWARVLTSVARYKIPQKLIDFYESRLTFKFLEEPATQDEVEDETEQAA